jgi:O-antigen/teichoic acid export membrane protein
MGGETGVEAVDARNVLGGAFWNTLGLLVPQFTTIALSVVAARVLGPTDLGRQSFIAFVELSVVALIAGGLPRALMRFTGEAIGGGRGTAARGLATWVLGLTAAGSIAGSCVLIGIAITRPSLRVAWLLAAGVVLLAGVQSVAAAILIGLRRWREANLPGVVLVLGGTVVTMVVLLAGGGIVGMFAVELGLAASTLTWSGVLAIRALRKVAPRGGDPALRAPALRYAGLAAVLIVLTLIVWRRSELFFLEQFHPASELAMYSIAFAAVAALTRAPEAVIFLIGPTVATLVGAQDEERIRAGVARSFRLLLVGALPLTAATLALGPAAVNVFYGEEYEEAGRVLTLLVLFFPLVPLARTASSVLSGLGTLRLPVIYGSVGAAVNIGLDFVLIPTHGAVGAAIASGTAQTLTGMPLVVHVSRRLGGISWQWGRVARVALASAAAGAIARAVVELAGDGAGLAVGLVLGAAAFALAAAMTRAVPPEDLAWIESAAGWRLGGAVGRACRFFGSGSSR